MEAKALTAKAGKTKGGNLRNTMSGAAARLVLNIQAQYR
jgi:hypothetical protein